MKSINQSLAVIAVLTGVFTYTGYAPAAMYKWVDKDGNVNYSQSPPPGSKADIVKPPPRVDTNQAIKQFKERNKQFDERVKARQQESKKASQKADKKAKMKKNCDIAKGRVQQLVNGYQMSTYDKEGNRIRMTEDQRQAKIAQAKKDVAEHCQ